MNTLDKHNAGRIPAKRILSRDDLDCYAIIHFGLNTFTDKEWGFGDESAALFNPSQFDAEQIARTCKETGLNGLILVCKHHDGFCLWPTKTTEHNIRKAPFRNGNGDLVGEFADACRKYKLKMGFYVSPWDRNNPAYGTGEYLNIFRQQLREVLSNYGSAFEVWFDGANGGDGYYGGAREVRKIDHTTYYDWINTWDIVRKLQPDACIFSDIGPDLRWVGNEKGFALPETFGSCTPVPLEEGKEPAPGFIRSLDNTTGHPDGRYYIPPECDVPLRPGWFYHAHEDNAQRSRKLLLKIYLNSVGNGGFLNLGLAPDKRGILHENDVARLHEFKQDRDALFGNKVAGGKIRFESHTATLLFSKPEKFNLLEFREDLTQGELITDYTVEIASNGIWEKLLRGKAIGRKRLKFFAMQHADALRITVHASHAPVSMLDIAVYQAPENLLELDDLLFDLRSRKDYQKLVGGDICANEITFRLPDPKRITGLIFTPKANISKGSPDQFEFFADGAKIAESEFSNLRANPIPQLIRFKTVSASVLKFRAKRYLDPGEQIVLEELGILVE